MTDYRVIFNYEATRSVEQSIKVNETIKVCIFIILKY